jgi:SAM-dependent methyltransferase
MAAEVAQVAKVAAQLRRGNLMYREPRLYDEAMRGDEPVEAIADQIDRYAPAAGSVLDIGCGTGRTLRRLCESRGLDGIGVDVQPELFASAGNSPRCRWVAADARTVRLQKHFDVILCLGNTAAYMHSADELTTLLTTFAAHSHPGTLLLMMTLLGAPRVGESRNVRSTCLGAATVHTRSLWDPRTRMLTMWRRWEFADGRIEQDLIRRRSPTVDELTSGLAHAGFQVLAIGGPQDPLSVIARHRH